jgi:hypothetical protein
VEAASPVLLNVVPVPTVLAINAKLVQFGPLQRCI